MAIEERKSVIVEIADERARWDAERPHLDRAIERAEARVGEARTFLRMAEEALTEAQGRQRQAAIAHDARVGHLERRLRAGASEVLDEFINDVRGQLEALRTLVEVHESVTPPNILGERTRQVVSNAESVERRRLALVAAAAAAEGMRLEALGESEIVTKLTELRDGIPEIERLSMEPPPLFTRGELRRMAWRAEPSAAPRGLA
jgi:hypothetical protein